MLYINKPHFLWLNLGIGTLLHQPLLWKKALILKMENFSPREQPPAPPLTPVPPTTPAIIVSPEAHFLTCLLIPIRIPPPHIKRHRKQSSPSVQTHPPPFKSLSLLSEPPNPQHLGHLGVAKSHESLTQQLFVALCLELPHESSPNRILSKTIEWGKRWTT